MADGMPIQSDIKCVHRAIHAVMRDCNAKGLGKSGWNDHQKYHFRSIDDIYALIGTLLVEHDLIVTPHLRDLKSEIQPTKNSYGKDQLTNYVLVTVDYHFVSIEDGSTHLVSAPGEAFDTGDKATNKAMSAAYKYMAFQAFHIPLEGQQTPDSDRDTFERAGPRKQTAESAPAKPVTLTKADARPEYKQMVDEICAIGSTSNLKDWGTRNIERVKKLPADWVKQFRAEYSAKLEELKEAEETDRQYAIHDEARV